MSSSAPNFDKDKLLTEAAQLRDAVATQAGRIAVRAVDLAEQGVDWATPRAQAALENVFEKAAPVARMRPVKKRHPFRKAFGITALVGTAVGVGYILWKRSQPIEDPWAEEYWADLDTDVPVPDMPAEEVDDVDQEELDEGILKDEN